MYVKNIIVEYIVIICPHKNCIMHWFVNVSHFGCNPIFAYLEVSSIYYNNFWEDMQRIRLFVDLDVVCTLGWLEIIDR